MNVAALSGLLNRFGVKPTGKARQLDGLADAMIPAAYFQALQRKGFAFVL
jgi:hypothetical protein